MMKKWLLACCCVVAAALPTFALALNDATSTAVAQPEPAVSAPAKPATVPAAPEKAIAPPSAPVQSGAAQTAPAAPSAAQPLPVKPAPPKPLPPKPVPAPSTSARPLPLRPLPAKPAHEIPAASKPLAASSAPAIPEKPAPKQTAHSAPTADFPAAPLSQTNDIEIFIRESCQQCDKAREFLGKLHSLQPQLKIATRDVRKEPAALELLKRMTQSQGDVSLDYPAFIVGGQLIIGFTEEAGTAQLILDTLAINHPADEQASADAEACTTGREPSCGLIPPARVPKPETTIISLFGYNIPLAQIGLPVFTVTMGLLDGFNFGSTWVLILLISLLAPLKNRSLIVAIAGTFITVQGVIYFAVMAAWFNLSLLIEISRISQIVYASIALLAAAVYLRNYMQHGQNISISSPEINKPGIYTRIRKIVQAPNIVIALTGVAVLAILVQFGEFAYKSVFPLLYTRVLILQHLDNLSNYAYLVLYDFSYMLDDIVVMLLGVATLNQRRPQETEGRMLKFVSALVMFGVGIYLLRAMY